MHRKFCSFPQALLLTVATAERAPAALQAVLPAIAASYDRRRKSGVRMRAVVIGCGIGGATAALALAEIGVEVEVYEAAALSADHDGWVTLGPAAMTGLDRVGIADGVWAVGFPVVSVRAVDTATGGVTPLLLASAPSPSRPTNSI
jgi:hypothetical protein